MFTVCTPLVYSIVCYFGAMSMIVHGFAIVYGMVQWMLKIMWCHSMNFSHTRYTFCFSTFLSMGCQFSILINCSE